MRQLTKNACPACLSENTRDVGKKNDFLLECCGICGTTFAKVDFDEDDVSEEVKQLYENYYESANFTLQAASELSIQNTIQSFEKFRDTGNLLDVGYGEGGFLGIAAKNNWNCYGTELSPQALKYGNQQGWTVSKDALSDDLFPKNGFDVITMIELIEHVPNPDDFFQTAYSLLRPGGLLYITTPNIKSINSRWLGINWSSVAPPEHVTIWSPTGMKMALKRNNFFPKKVAAQGFNPFEILAHVRSKKGNTPEKVNRNETGFALNESFTKSPFRRAVKSVINKGLVTFQLGDNFRVWAIKRA